MNNYVEDGVIKVVFLQSENNDADRIQMSKYLISNHQSLCKKISVFRKSLGRVLKDNKFRFT